MRFVLVVFVVVLWSTAAPAAFDYRPAVRALAADAADANDLRLAEKADAALALLVDVAEWRLKAGGYGEYARELRDEWEASFRGVLPALVWARQTGALTEREVPEEYAPLSAWLSDWYHTLRALLGVQVCEMLHLDDLQVINWGAPVVFRLSQVGDAAVTADQYALYFCPFAGVVAYWTTWGVCTGVTWGTGAFFVCTPAAMIAEEVVVRRVAPAWSARVWERVYRDDE